MIVVLLFNINYRSREAEAADEKEVEAPQAEEKAEPEQVAAPPTESTKDEQAVAETTDPVDPELEKRKKRAARFGIPLVEPTPKPAPKAKKGAAAKEVRNVHCASLFPLH